MANETGNGALRIRDVFRFQRGVDMTQETVVGLWLWGKKSPFMASLIRLHPVDEVIDCTDAGLVAPLEGPQYRYWFQFDPREHMHSEALDFGNDWDISVLPYMRFPYERFVASLADWCPLDEWCLQCPVATATHKEKGPKRERSGPAPQPNQLPVEEFPWLHDLTSSQPIVEKRRVPRENADRESEDGEQPAQNSDGPAQPGGNGTGAEEDHEHDPDDSHMNLLAFRASWEATVGRDAEDFFVEALGGPWTRKHKGVDVDAYSGLPVEGKEGPAGEWLRSVCLPGQCSNYFSMYDEHGAGMLARVWVIKMQHCYDLALAGPPAEWTHQLANDCNWPPEISSWMSNDNGPRVQRRLRYIMNLLPTPRR